MPRQRIQNFTNSLNFNGTNAYAALPKINATTALTFGLWVKPRNVGNYDIMSRPAGTSTRLQTTSAGTLRFEIGLSVSGLTTLVAGNYSPGQWTHLVCRYDGAVIALFVNGVFISSSPGTGTISQDVSQFWNLATLNTSLFTPMLASSAFIATTALTNNDILKVYQASTLPSGIASYWRLDEGAGTSLADSSGNGQSGTANNTNWSTDVPTRTRSAASIRPRTRDIKASLTGAGVAGYVNFGVVDCSADTVESVMLWFKATTRENSIIFGNAGNNAGTGFSVRHWIDGPSLYLYHDSQAAFANVPSWQWVHIGAVFKNSGALSLYVNGVLVNTSSATSTTSLGNATLYIGSGGSGLYTGMVSRVVFGKNTEFRAMDIQNNYLSGAIPGTATNVWNLDEGAGSTVYDSLGSLTGTITNDYYTVDAPMRKRQAVGGNLLYNGDFEFAPPFIAATTGTGRFIDGTAAGSTTNSIFGWSASNAGTCSAQFDGTSSHSGKYSLKASTLAAASYIEIFTPNTAGQPVSYFAKTNTPVLPNTTYNIGYWMKTNYVSGTSNDGATIIVLECTGDGGTASHQANGTYVKTTTPWTQYTYTFTTTTNTRFVQVNPVVYGHTGVATLIMDAWFDDITLVPAAPLPRGAAT